nr:hypothetical protein [Brevundimonas diminuta]
MVELSVNIGRDCGGEMADLEAEIITRCQALGLGRCGLGSIRNFIATAFYHASLPGTLPADRHVAFNSAIRFATNRIACQGRDGASIWSSRVLSRRAYELRQALLTDHQPERAKVKAWTQAVTFEHQDPVWEVQDWIDKDSRIGVDDVIKHEALLREAGVFHPPETSVWREASDWFDKLYRGAEPVSASALESAKASWRVGPRGEGRKLRAGSLLDLVRAQPQHFANVGFVFTGVASTEEERRAARKAATEGLEEEGAAFASWAAGDIFCGWGGGDLAQWPSLFFEFWIPKSRLSVYARDMRFKELKTGSIFTTKQRGWLSNLGVNPPSLKEAGNQDAELARRIVEERGSVVFPSGYALREQLERMELAKE